MLFSASLHHIELISIYAFYTLKNYAEELLYAIVKIHTALGCGKPHFWEAEQGKKAQDRYMVTLSLLIFVFNKLWCRTPDAEAVSLYFIVFERLFSFMNLFNHLLKLSELLLAATRPCDRNSTCNYGPPEKYLLLRLFTHFQLIPPLASLSGKTADMPNMDNLPTNSLLTTAPSPHKRHAGSLNHQEIVMPGTCYFLLGIVGFCTVKNLKLPAISGH